MGRQVVRRQNIFSLSIIFFVLFSPAWTTLAQQQQDDKNNNGVDMLESVQCLLDTSRTLNIQYSELLQQYVEVHALVDADAYNSALTLVADNNDGDDDDGSDGDDETDRHRNTHHPILQVRACWCSQYFDRRHEYCPAVFDSCRVEGFRGPVTCLRDDGGRGGTFVRGFWFVCVFWFLALAYAFSCTEQGTAASGFCRRKLCLRWKNSAPCCRSAWCCCWFWLGRDYDNNGTITTEREFLGAEIRRMVQRDPDRAAWLLRSAFLRDQNRQRIRQQRDHRRRQRQQRHRAAAAGSTATTATAEEQVSTHNNNNDNDNNTLSAWHQTMELKVKKYDGLAGADDAAAIIETNTTIMTKSEDEDEEDNAADNQNHHHVDETASIVSAFSFANASQLLSSALALAMSSSIGCGGSDPATATTTSRGNQNDGSIDHCIMVNDDDNNHDYDDDVSSRGGGVKCAICLSTVRKGDRIGDIPCGHIFCVECLKDWLKRKNHCPLCQRGGLATPRRNQRQPPPQRGGGGDLEEGGTASSSSPSTSDRTTRSSSRRRGLIVSLPANLPARGRRSRS